MDATDINFQNSQTFPDKKKSLSKYNIQLVISVWKWVLTEGTKTVGIKLKSEQQWKPIQHWRVGILIVYRNQLGILLQWAIDFLSIGHFTVVCLDAKPLNGCEAQGDLVLIQTLLLLISKCLCLNGQNNQHDSQLWRPETMLFIFLSS